MMRILGDWLLLPQRFALHEPSGTAVLADLHLGYSAARQRLGDAIPGRGVEEELAPLIAAAAVHPIHALVVAGDLFERGFDAAIFQEWLDVLDRLKIRFLGLVPGNHDRIGPQTPHAALPIFPDGYDLAGWQIRHGDEPSDDGRSVTGHWHPALRLKRRKRPCFLVHGQRLILPAFSLDAAGADVRSDPRWRGWDCYVIGGAEVVQHCVAAR